MKNQQKMSNNTCKDQYGDNTIFFDDNNNDWNVNKPFINNNIKKDINIYPLLNIISSKLNNKHRTKYINKENNINLDKHYPSATKEWFNSVYTYNKNYLKSLPIADKILIRLIRSYFNLFEKTKDKKISSRLHKRFLRLSINKIFISRAELKHTSTKIIINLFVYNRQRKYIFNKLKQLNIMSAFCEKIDIVKKQNLYILKQVQDEKQLIIDTLKWKKINAALNLNNNIFQIYENNFYIDFIKKSLEREMLSLYYKHLLYFNKLKFEYTYLTKLNSLISKVYKKKIEFNIVNLKYLYLNSDILSESIVLKLKNRENRFLAVLKTLMNMIRIEGLNKITEINNFNVRRTKEFLQINKINKFNFSSLFTTELCYKKDNLNQLLIDIFSEGNTNNFENIILYLIKYKTVNGIRLEARGRLSKRLTASRSLFKFKYKGSLKNIDSSYNNLSSVLLRGHLRSNIQYTKISSKTRNGSFGIKGWVSSK